MDLTLHGMSWEDTRCLSPLGAAAAAFAQTPGGHDVRIAWDTCSQADLEIGQQMANDGSLDLVLIDTATLAAEHAAGRLTPIGKLPDAYVGRSRDAVTINGEVLAAPVDVSCMVSAIAQDMTVDLPTDFERIFFVYCPFYIGSPQHGGNLLNMLASILTGRGAPIDPEIGFPQFGQMDYCLHILYLIRRRSSMLSGEWTGQAALDALVADKINYLPLTWADANYEREHFVHFAPAPSTSGVSLLNCYALAVPTASRNREAAVAFARFVADPETQIHLWRDHHGQPAARSAWELLARQEPFFARLRGAVDQAWLRPQLAGWPSFANAASAALAEWMKPADIMDLPDIRAMDETLRALARVLATS